MVERHVDLRFRYEKVPLVDAVTFLLPNGGKLLPNLSGKNELTAHQGRDMHAARGNQMANEVAQPAQQLCLMDVRLPDLPVQPQHQCLWRPALDIDVEHELLCLVRELIGDAVAVQINLKAASRLAYC